MDEAKPIPQDTLTGIRNISRSDFYVESSTAIKSYQLLLQHIDYLTQQAQRDYARMHELIQQVAVLESKNARLQADLEKVKQPVLHCTDEIHQAVVRVFASYRRHKGPYRSVPVCECSVGPIEFKESLGR